MRVQEPHQERARGEGVHLVQAPVPPARRAHLDGAIRVFQQGGSFAISVSANVHPEASVEVWRQGYEEEDYQRAFELNRELRPLHDAMFQEGEKNPISVQYAVNLLGFDYGTPRAPLNRRPREDEEYSNRTESRNV
jgi:dihydrodipicolinate synthase/N-acetylneuraminate lyase